MLFRTTKSLNPFKFSEEYNFNLWLRALGNMFKLFLLFALPMAILTLLVEATREINLILGNIIVVFQFATLYFLGVYIAHKHHLWRLQNLPAFKNVDDERV